MKDAVRTPSNAPAAFGPDRSPARPPSTFLRRTSGAVAAIAVAAGVVMAGFSVGCKVKDPPAITDAWADDFLRDEIGGNYYPTSNNYKIVDGALSTQGAFNHPLWLRKKLPRDVSIEFDCWSNSAAGDIKIELFGDGRTHAKNKGQYTSSGYAIVMGGWSNTISIIARRNEHGKDRKERRAPRVVKGKKYHWKLVRQGTKLSWYVDDMTTPFLSMDDAEPLEGPGHEYFAFTNWESDSWFDNLKITPL